MKIKISIPKFLLRLVFGLFLVISLLCGFFIYFTIAQQFLVWNPPPVQAPIYVPGEIVVKFKPGVKQANIEMFNQEQGATVLETNSVLGFMRLKTPAGKTVEELVAIYSKNPDVEYAEPNFIVTAYMVPNDPYYKYQWHLYNSAYGGINMQTAWDISTGSSSVIVAVIDTGVAYEDYGGIYLRAPDLAGTTFVPGYDFINGDSHPNDDNSHGTHVTGTIAQTTNNSYGVAGVAFQTAIMPIKVLGKDGSGSDTTVANGIQYAADNGAKVINMSLGGPSPSSTLENAVKYAYNKGVTIIAATGNDGKEGVSYPAAYEECIAVGATRYDEAIAYYSNYGAQIDLVAPGGDVTVDQNGDTYPDGVLQQTFNPDTHNPKDFGFWFFQGTSMAAPHASGVAALVIAKFGDIGPDNVRQKLETTAEDHGAAGWDKYYGWGIVDAYKALSQPPHTVTITSGPTANPATIDSGGTTNLSVTATDSLGHAIAYSWTADPPEGSFSDANAQNPTWTAPVNDTGADKVYTLTVTAKCTVDPNVKDTKSVEVTVESVSWPVNPGDVVINELMWMGSTLSTADEWIELRNTTVSDIDLSNWDITRKSGDSDVLMLTIPVGKTIAAGGYFLISNYDAEHSKINVSPDLVDTAVSLANTQLQIKLYDGPWKTSTLIDTADDGTGAPAAGDQENKYSMSRGTFPGAPPGDGTLAENWHTADRAIGWDPDATERGTPGYDNAFGSGVAASVTLVASPDTLIPGCASKSTITAIVKDADGNPVKTETVTMTITPAGNGQITSPATNNGDGTYTATYTAGATVGTVTITATTSNQISGNVEINLTPVCKPGDVSGNGVVTAYDASLILQFVVGLIDKFPVEQSPIPGTPQSYSIAVPHLMINAGGKIQAPINIDDMSGITVGGLVLRYDPNILRAVKVLTSEILSGYYWQSNIERKGEVRIAFAGTSTRSGHGTLFYVEFEMLPNNIGKISPLVLDFAQVSELNNITRANGSITILPSRSMLLQNYPNPFNPVTWIPYLLAEPSDVTVKIYSETGQLVRALPLGYRSAGVYTSQGQAAYWDGKDEHGESIASGVYFYCLQAGKFTATRKMVIVK